MQQAENPERTFRSLSGGTRRRKTGQCLTEARAQSPEAAQLAEKLGHMYDDSWTALENLWIELETAERDDQVVTEGAKT